MDGFDLEGRIRRLATKRSWSYRTKPGKDSHLKVWLNGRRSVIPMHRGDMPIKTFNQILRDLGLTRSDLEV
jgi:thiamine phosphate synthase YjbQ (UPF0047 family)